MMTWWDETYQRRLKVGEIFCLRCGKEQGWANRPRSAWGIRLRARLYWHSLWCQGRERGIL